MSTPFRLLAGVILASIFLGMFVGIYQNFGQSQGKKQFFDEAKELANRIDSWEGGKINFTITIPQNCSLSFKEENIVASCENNESNNYEIGENISGPTLNKAGDYTLQIMISENGVEVNVK
ncbi:MAG: hypothetical protein KGY45_03265 [Hadesarchaea archaeon]|nr:hypothetical protein [Hadesarchaea archaeon]